MPGILLRLSLSITRNKSFGLISAKIVDGLVIWLRRTGITHQVTPSASDFAPRATTGQDDATGRCHKREFLLKWTQSIAVGSKTFVETMKQGLGFSAKGRKIICDHDTFELREMTAPFGKVTDQDYRNTYLWNQ